MSPWFAIGLIVLAVMFCKSGTCKGAGISGLKVLGIAAMLFGIGVFGMRGDRGPRHVGDEHRPRAVADEHGPLTNHRFMQDFSPRLDFDPDFDLDFDPAEAHAGVPRWGLIVLGTILVITGSLLAGRERTRPVALKAFTFLGMAAIVYAVVSFFSSPPRDVSENHDRIVKLSHDHVREAVRDAAHDVRESITVRRPTRAKRPSIRSGNKPEPSVAQDALPPRAGEIPVAEELARPEPMPTAEKTASAESSADAPAPATVEPSPIASNSPSPEPVKVAAPAAAEPTVAPPAKEPLAARPAWVDAPPKLTDGVYSIAVASGLYSSVPECQQKLDLQLKREADHYVEEYRGAGAALAVDLPLEYLKKRVKKAEYAEVVHSTSVGPMHQIHALLEFDDEVRSAIHRRYHDALVAQRLWYTGAGAALVLGLLATLYGYLKLDLHTGGTRKGQLQLAATLTALIVAAGALLIRWAVPF